MWYMWYIVIVAGWLTCSAVSYLLLRRFLQDCGAYTTGDRRLNLMGSILFGPVMMVTVLVTSALFWLSEEGEDEARW